MNKLIGITHENVWAWGKEQNQLQSLELTLEPLGGGGEHSVIKVRGTSDGTKSLDNDTSQMPRDIHMDAARQEP